jgi:formyl-CoA transferase
MIKKATHPVKGEVSLVGFPFSLSDTPLGPVKAPDMLGEHSEAILREFGYADEDIARMRVEKLI